MSSTLWLVGLGCLLAGAALTVAFFWVRGLARADRAKFIGQVAAEVIARQAAEKAAGEVAATAAQQVAEWQPLLMSTEADKRGKAHWTAVDISERATSLILQAAEDAEVLMARQQNLLTMLEWIRDGGNPKAPWNEIIKWKNAQESK